jgi:hypothetical protein
MYQRVYMIFKQQNISYAYLAQNKLGKGQLLDTMSFNCPWKCARSVTAEFLRHKDMGESGRSLQVLRFTIGVCEQATALAMAMSIHQLTDLHSANTHHLKT